MVTVTGYTSDKMDEISDNTIVDGTVNGSGHLILTTRGGTDIDTGNVKGTTGLTGPTGATSIVICTSGTRPTASEGLGIWETDTNKFLIYNGFDWTPPWNSPWGYLDYAEKVSNQAGFTNSESNVTGLGTSSITIPANRRIKISCFIRDFTSDTNDSLWSINIKEGLTTLQSSFSLCSFAGISMPTNCPSVVLIPSAGSHIYHITANRAAGLGAATIEADTNAPSYILVEDIGPSGAPA